MYENYMDPKDVDETRSNILHMLRKRRVKSETRSNTMKFFTPKKLGIGIDLGTTNLLVYVQGHGIIFSEPSVVAFDVETGNVIAGGHEAFAMIGKTHGKIRVSRPLRDGVISDMDAAKALLKFVFNRVQAIRSLKNSRCLICCPSEVTQIERDALKELAIKLGISDVFIEEEIKSGAIGTGIEIYGPEGAMIIDIGGGTTDVGVLSLGDVVLSKSIRIAGNHIDNEIIKYVHRAHSIVIGSTTAEQLKIKLATLKTDNLKSSCEISGRDLVSGLPASTVVTAEELYTILTPIFDEIVNVIYTVLEQTPPELSSDIVNNGVVIDGGGACIPGLKEFLEEKLHLSVTIAQNPLSAVVEGTKILLKNNGSYLGVTQD